MLYARPMKPSTNTAIRSTKGSQHSLPRTCGEPSITRTTARHRPVMIGIGSSAMICGSANQRSRTVGLTHGVAIEISAMPTTTGSHASLAQATAWRCSSPSVLRISQAAPSST